MTTHTFRFRRSYKRLGAGIGALSLACAFGVGFNGAGETIAVVAPTTLAVGTDALRSGGGGLTLQPES